LLTPGTWSASIGCVQWSESWHVDPGRESFFLVDLSGLRETWIQVVERATQAPVPVSVLEFSRTDQAVRPAAWGMLTHGPHQYLEPFRLQALEGPYRFRISDGGGIQAGFLSAEVPSLGGPDGVLLAVDVAANRPGVLSIVLSSHGTPVPLADSWWNRLEFWSDSGSRIQFGTRSLETKGPAASHCGVAKYTLPPGVVEIRFPVAEDFAAIAPMRTIVSPEQTTDILVEMLPAY
jgi:hypothetical protein